MAHRILVVDDETHILQVLSLKLRNSGFEVSTAVDGEDALGQVLENPPDLVITDIQMPYMNGIELCNALVENTSTKLIPVIVITARGHTLSASDTDIENVRQVISKPFSPREVAELASSILADIASERINRSEAA
ncbi:MAG: response regulator [Phycisphaerales bacterium]|jgi:two-component system alkaline phosphatase synthesis response regulator PhoP|nr:response regulator [Phycisphaerales bacterium]